jgi:cytoskeletal protein RodZ
VFDIGSSLRDARVRQGLDFPDLEERTKIRPKYLRALEDERFDVLPAPTYVRGFLRSYADALGLDGQPFVDEYNTRFAVGDEETVVHARRVPVSPRRDRGRQQRESHMALLALVSIAVVTALVFVAWRFGGPESEPVHGLAQPEQQTAHPRSLAPTRLVVRASGDSWMEVRAGSASGRLLYSGTLERGQRKSFDGRRLHLALARPDNVSLRVNGSAVAMPAGTTFSITAARIAPAIP